ncbi:unnamed protein product [Protopolystoma xenopodis]|uniref:Uncharacterized protein n=1 Tax=Protopolystoma xenopodis TaxID=117903 RepID=A0A448XI05_9PLAT|nr:unnamed protein product [Protopolystoma xenopodis]
MGNLVPIFSQTPALSSHGSVVKGFFLSSLSGTPDTTFPPHNLYSPYTIRAMRLSLPLVKRYVPLRAAAGATAFTYLFLIKRSQHVQEMQLLEFAKCDLPAIEEANVVVIYDKGRGYPADCSGGQISDILQKFHFPQRVLG